MTPEHAELCERVKCNLYGARAVFSVAVAPNDLAALLAAITALSEEVERLRAAFRVNMLRAFPDKSHAEIDAEIARAALGEKQ